MRPSDADLLLAMWGRTSAELRRARFMGLFTLARENAGRLIALDAAKELPVVATRGRGDTERMLGIARCVLDEDEAGRAEFAALVEDGEQSRGIGTTLVREVAVHAREVGITQLSGDILASNTRMLNLVRQLGLEYEAGDDGDVVHSDLETNLTERFLAVIDEEERQAALAASARFLRPDTIAVVGASRNPLAIGGLVFDNALRGGFHGAVYPVNRNATAVQGVATYSALADCPTVPDLVMVCVPAPLVNDIVKEAGWLGVKATCVISAGFAEVDSGEPLQEELLARARSHGMRLVGPNCMGLTNGRPEARMNTTFSTTFPRPRRVSMSSQSGALTLAVLEHDERLGLGIPAFVSVGNKADLSGNDLLLYWEEDADTNVILMCLESFGNLRKFSRIVRRISRTKPTVAVKWGRTGAGEQAASSHTAAISASDTAVGALFGQTGVIRTETLEELFDVATMLSSQGLPRGQKVAVLTNAGGPGMLAADALESNGLEVPALSDRTVAQLAEFPPAEASMHNPVDMIASASAEAYRRAMSVLGNADEVDAPCVIFIPTGPTATDDVARALLTAKDELSTDVPVISVFTSATGMPSALEGTCIPSFAFPEATARALGRVADYARWRRRPLGNIVGPTGIDRDAARRIVERVLEGVPAATAAQMRAGEDAGRWCSTEEATAIFDAYGITSDRSRSVSASDEGAALQRDWGVPVAVKVAAAIHKADVGGLTLELRSGGAVAKAIGMIERSLAAHDLSEHVGRYLVQEMVDGGVEMVVGIPHDPSFGPIVVTGMGGTLVELLRDVAVRITPVTDEDVNEMLDELRMAPLLRGAAPADVAALKGLIRRVNAMVEDLPEVAELDLNPVFVRPDRQGVVVVRLRLAPTARPTR